VESFIEFVGGLAFKQILGGSLGLIGGIAFKSSHILLPRGNLQSNSSKSHPVHYLTFQPQSNNLLQGVSHLSRSIQPSHMNLKGNMTYNIR